MGRYDTENAALANDAGYRAALQGQPVPGEPFPMGPDGLVLPGFRPGNARAYARRKGLDFGGHIDPQSGQISDPDVSHWYSDPRVIGPLAVGGATLGLGALGGVGGGASAGSGAAGAGVGVGETAGGFGVGGLSATSLGVPATAGLGTAGGAATGATIAGAGGTAASKILQQATDQNADASTAQRVAGLLAGVGGLFGGKALGNSMNQDNIPPELSQLLALSLDRAKSQQGLFNQVNSGVSQMLPNFASSAAPTAQDMAKFFGGH
jgi:hypothetical protein